MLKRKSLVVSIVMAATTVIVSGRVGGATEPGWSPIVLPTGEYREQVKSLPIEQRPYRPLHFYGNTVRRNFYRGNPLPAPKDLRTTARELIRRD